MELCSLMHDQTFWNYNLGNDLVYFDQITVNLVSQTVNYSLYLGAVVDNALIQYLKFIKI